MDGSAGEASRCSWRGRELRGITFEQPWGTGHDRGEFTEAAGRTEPYREEAQQGESKRQDLLREATACNPPKRPHGEFKSQPRLHHRLQKIRRCLSTTHLPFLTTVATVVRSTQGTHPCRLSDLTSLFPKAKPCPEKCKGVPRVSPECQDLLSSPHSTPYRYVLP